MPMTGSGLATAVKAAVASIPLEDRDHDAVWNAIGDAIVTYIKANATVTVTGTASGVTVGGAAVPVTGSGTIG